MDRQTKLPTIATFIAVALVGVGFARGDDVELSHSPRNVLLIIVDTLRADRLGCYGSDLGATPNIDKFAGTGVRFDRAYAHSSWTLPACATILTSLHPPQHGAGGNLGAFRKLPDSVRTIAEHLRDSGYATGAIVNVDFLTDSFGMTQGFTDVDSEFYRNNTEMRSAAKTTDAALAWLKTDRQQPFFLMVHYFDPHLVYAPPPEYRRRFAAPPDREQADWVFGTRRHLVGYRRGVYQFDDATIRRAEHLYNGEVAYTDHEVGRLLSALPRMGLADSTVVALTADHGEEFLDHGGFEHGHTLYNELVHIPLIIRGAKGTGGRSIASAVGHVDIAPTLCESAGIAPDPAFVGRSLVGLMNHNNDKGRPIVFEGNFWGDPLRGWLQRGYKLIIPDNGAAMLFNIVADPLEKKDLHAAEPDRVKQMLEDLRLTYKKMSTHKHGEDPPVELSPEQLERLRSLGYTG